MTPIRPDLEAGFWYFYYFLTERGRAGLTAYRRDIARVIWRRNSPNLHFDDATLERAAVAFDNPDYVEIVLPSYRHRLGYAPGFPPYDQVEQKLAAQPAITVPAVTLDDLADGNFPATDGSTSARYFTGPRVHHQVQGRGSQPSLGGSRRLRQRSPGTGTSSITARRSVRLLTR